MVTKLSKLAKREEGQSIVEFAIIAPLFLLMLVGFINFGMVVFSYLNLNMTAQEATRLAGLGKSDAQIVQYAKDKSAVKKPDQITVTISPANRKSGDYVTVTISYPMNELTPIFDEFLSSYQLTTKSTIRVE
jgi:Flp pilus assembly protein TadG